LGLVYLVLTVYVCIQIILAFVPVFQELNAELDLIKIILELIQRLFAYSAEIGHLSAPNQATCPTKSAARPDGEGVARGWL